MLGTFLNSLFSFSSKTHDVLKNRAFDVIEGGEEDCIDFRNISQAIAAEFSFPTTFLFSFVLLNLTHVN